MLGIITAMPCETSNLHSLLKLQYSETLSNIEYFVGNLNKKTFVFATGGVGKVNSAICAQTMALRFGVSLVLNFGFAGTACENIDVGDLVIAKNVVQHDVDTSALGDPFGMISTINLTYLPCDETICSTIAKNICILNKTHIGTVATGDKFISDATLLKNINKKFSALCTDMEAGSIAQICYLNKIKFSSVKMISDSALKKSNAAKDYLKSTKNFPNKLCNLIYSIVPNLL